MDSWKVLVLLCVAFEAVNALDCISCSWTVENDTVDSNCLSAPYKMPVTTCPKPSSPGEIYVCAILATFEVQQDIMGLEALERKCAKKHSRCNKACADSSPICWQCCNDDNSCNGFPLRGNIVTISKAISQTGSALIVTILVAISFAYNLMFS